MQLSTLVDALSTMHVSVPSTGRSGLQPNLRELRGREPLRVSVPSTGRSGLQLGTSCHAMNFPMFQYPLRVEVGCNYSRPGAHRASELSFSTLYGSKWVATRSPCSKHTSRTGFSTLYGSKWVATSSRLARPTRSQGFQYPLRVEVGCNKASIRLP